MFVSPYVCLVALTSLYLVSYLNTECYGFHILDYANSDYTSRIKRQSCGFRCANGTCVDGDSKCNGISDCADGSDESPQICAADATSVMPSTHLLKLQGETTPKARRIRRQDGSCALPPTPANGKYTADVSQSLIKLTYSCPSGYQIYPSLNTNVTTCVSGKWNPGLFECLRTCAPRISDTVDTNCEHNGIAVDCSKSMVEGTIVRMKCMHLFSQVDSSANRVSECKKNGAWDYAFIECAPECGNEVSKGKAFIIGGENVKTGTFPWHVGIYKLDSANQFEQTCGGSIISRKVIISAAHCFTSHANGALYDLKLYAIGAGKYYRNYNDKRDTLSQTRTIKEIIIPPRYKGLSTSYTADIAFLTLDKALEITHVVQPVCIDWNNKYEATQLKDNNIGTVVGWGYTKEDQDPSAELKQLSVPFVNFEQCFESVPDSFARFLTNDKLCAGLTNGRLNGELSALLHYWEFTSSSVCHGDSGGGLVFKQKDTKKYYLRGLVSVGPLAKGKCDSKQYGAYTKVSDYMAMLRDMDVSSKPSVTPPTLPDGSCALPPQPANGRYTTDQSLTKLTYSCSPGYQIYPSSSTNITICYLGKWFPNHPVCVLKSCTLQSNNATGQCVLLKNCPRAIENLQKGIHPQICVYDGTELIVCCEKRVGDISKQKCKEYGHKNQTDKCAIVDPLDSSITRRAANPREYPHMALLGYGEENNIHWECSGTVISEQFVLTSAYCLNNYRYGPVRWIRVGELVLDSNTDEAQPKDLSVLESIKHPQYVQTSYYNDIGLVKVNGQIQFNRFVRPACLHTTTFINTTQYIATGWELGVSALQRQILDNFSHIFHSISLDRCNNYRSDDMNYRFVPETQICAGRYFWLCRRGVSLQIFSKEVYCMYNIVGVHNIVGVQASGSCGFDESPGVFTRVSHYIDWIEKIVWPDEI